MRRVAAIVISGVVWSTAQASPLGVMWKRGGGCPDPERQHPFETERGLVWTDHGKLVRWARPTGADVAPVKIKGKSPYIAAVTAELIIVRDSKELTALDPTLHLKWRRPTAPAAEVAVAGADVVYVAPAVHGKRSVELLDGATGKPKWTAEVANPTGLVGFVVATSAQVVIASSPPPPKTEGAPAPSTITALALADGAPKWKYETPSQIAWAANGAVRAIGDVVAVSTIDALVLLGPDGHASKVALPRPMLKRVLGTRLYGDDFREIWAVDVPSRKQLWASPLASATFVAASDTAVYAVGANESISELDPKTGKLVSTYAVGGQEIFGFEGAPHLVVCDKTSAFALDASMPDQPSESVTISGKLVCDGCEQRPVHAGDATTTTDDNGSFTLKTTARGTLDVAIDVGDGPVSVRIIRLDGSHTYQLGTVSVTVPVLGD